MSSDPARTRAGFQLPLIIECKWCSWSPGQRFLQGSGQAPNPRRELSAKSPPNPTESQFHTPPSSWVSCVSGVTMVGWGPSSTAPDGPFYYHPPHPNAYRMMSPAMMPPTVSAMPSAAAIACYPPQMHWQPQRQLAGYYPYFPQPKRESPTHSTQLQRRSSVGSLMLSTMSRTEFEGQHQAETDAAPKRAKVKAKGTNAPIFPTEPSPSKVDKVLMTDPATGTAVLIKPFRSKQSASQRAKLAKGKRVYACPFCDHLFSCSSNLIRHKRVHTGDKPCVDPPSPTLLTAFARWSHQKLLISSNLSVQTQVQVHILRHAVCHVQQSKSARGEMQKAGDYPIGKRGYPA